MVIQSCAFTIHFPQNAKIREHLFELERHFTDFQTPFTLVPLPPDAPLEIPRIVAATPHGHSQLTICGNSAQLVTHFDEEYCHNVERCITYIREKCNRIVVALSVMTGDGLSDPKFYYSGLSTTLLFDKSDGIEDPVKYISENFLRCKSNLTTDEVQFRLALVVQNKYYANILVQNNRAFLGVPDERGSFAGLKSGDSQLQVALDINDRYAFNHEKDYLSSLGVVNSIASLSEQFATKYIDTFLKTGVVSYDEQ